MKTRKTLFTWLLTAFVFSLFSLWGTTLRAETIAIDFKTTAPTGLGSYTSHTFELSGFSWNTTCAYWTSNSDFTLGANQKNFSKLGALDAKYATPLGISSSTSAVLELTTTLTYDVDSVIFNFTKCDAKTSLYLMVSENGGAFVKADEKIAESAENNAFTLKDKPISPRKNALYTVVFVTGNSGAASRAFLNSASIAKSESATTPEDPTVYVTPTELNYEYIKGAGSVAKTLTVTGSKLTGDVTVVVSGEGFSVDKTTLSVAEGVVVTTDEANVVTVTYNGSAASANGTLTLSSTDAENVVVNLTATAYSELEDLTKISEANNDGVYCLTGEMVVTHMDSKNNRVWVQDKDKEKGGALLLYTVPADSMSKISVGDVLQNVVGTKKVFSGLDEFIPTAFTIKSHGATVYTVEKTIDELQESDMNQLVCIKGIKFYDASGNFAKATDYTLTDGQNTVAFRYDYDDANYTDTKIPSDDFNLTAIVGVFNTTIQLAARNLSDIFLLPVLAFDETFDYGRLIAKDSTAKIDILGEHIIGEVTLSLGRNDNDAFSIISAETTFSPDGSNELNIDNFEVKYTHRSESSFDTAYLVITGTTDNIKDSIRLSAETYKCESPTLTATPGTTVATVAVNGGDNCKWQYKGGSQGDWSEVAEVDGNSISLNGLTAETEYEVRVWSNCAADVYSDTAKTSFTTNAVGTKSINFSGFAAGKKFEDANAQVSIGFHVEGLTLGTGADEYKIKVTIGGGAEVSTDTVHVSPFKMWLPSGNYTVVMEVVDQSGNVLSPAVSTGSAAAFSVDLPNVRKITFDPESSIYDEAQNVSITCATDGAAIQYRIGESGEWKDYSTAVAVDSSLTLFAKASKEHMDDTIDKAVYELMVKDVEFLTDGSVEYKNVVGVKLQCATTGAQIYYTIDGSDPATNGQLYADSIKLTADARVKAVAKKQGWTNSTLKDSAYRVVEVIKVEGALVFEENFSNCTETVWNGSTSFSGDSWTTSNVYKGIGGVRLGVNKNSGSLALKQGLDLSYNAGVYYIAFMAAKYDDNGTLTLTAGGKTQTLNKDVLPKMGVNDVTGMKEFVFKFENGVKSTAIKFESGSGNSQRALIDSIRVYQELPAFVKLGADATLDGIVSGTRQDSLTVEGNKLEDAITITTPRNDRSAFNVTPLSVAAAEANKVNTLSVTYTAQTVAGRDTLMVVAACGEAKDTAYVYAQTLPCGKAGNVEQDLNVTTAQFTVAGVDSVRYQYKQKAAAAWSTEANTTNDLITLSGLTAETTYQLRLRRICAAGYYSEYDTVEFTTLSATAKNVTLVQPTKDQVFTDSVWVKFSPANFKMADSGIARVTFSNRDTLYVASDTACKHLLQSGNYTVKVELLTKDRNVFTPAVSAGPVSFKVQLPKAAKPTFTPTNQTVAGGDSTFHDSVYVSMATATPDATIKYKLNTAAWRNYTEPILLEVGTQTLRAYAKATNTDNSDTLEMTYTIERTPGEEITFTKVTDAAEFLDGDKVIIVNGDKGLAMSSKVNSSKLLGTAVTINGNNILTEIATETEQQLPAQFVLVANPEGEGFAFQFGGKYLKGETGSTNCQFADAPSYYTISADESGNMNIVYNVSGGRMIRGYNSDFRQYVVKDNPDGQAVQIYLSEHGTASTDPSLTAAASVNISYNEGENGTAKIVVRGKNLEQAVTVAVKDSKAGFAVSPASLTAANVMRSVGDTVTVTYSGTADKDTAEIVFTYGSELTKTTYVYVRKVGVIHAADIKQLRGYYGEIIADQEYTIDGDVVVTHVDSSTNVRVWVQDMDMTNGASLLVYGIKTDNYNVKAGDVISGVTGTMVLYSGLLELKPTASFTIKSHNRPVHIDTLTIEQVNSGVRNWQSALVCLEKVHFNQSGNIASGKSYNLLDEGGNQVVFRTDYKNANYIGNPFPTQNLNVVAIVAEYNGTAQVTARDSNDIMVVGEVLPTLAVVPVIAPEETTHFDSVEVSITCDSANASIYYTLDGSTPGMASTLYTGTFKLYKTTTVKAVAAMDGYLPGTVAEKKYIVKASSEIVTPVGDIVFEENFSKCENAWDNSVDKSSELDTYTDMSGWTGNKVYPVKSAVKMGTGSILGYITSAEIDLSNNNGVYYVSFKASAWKGDATEIYLIAGTDTVTAKDLNNEVMSTTVSDDDAAAAWTDYAFKFENGAADTKITFTAIKANKNRFLLDAVKVYQELPADQPLFIGLPTKVEVSYAKGQSVSAEVAVKGKNLSEDVAVSVVGEGFTVAPATLAKADVMGETGAKFTLTYNGSADESATATLTVKSGDLSKNISVTATALPSVETLEDLYYLYDDVAAGTIGKNDVYVVTGDLVVTHKDSYSKRVYLQDADMTAEKGASILVYQAGDYGYDDLEVGDVIGGLRGTLTVYKGLFEVNPKAVMEAKAYNHDVFVDEVKIEWLLANDELSRYYQSALVKLNNVHILCDEGSVFSEKATYKVTDGTNDTTTVDLYVTFKDADYLDGNVNDSAMNLTGIITWYESSVQITPRSWADMEIIREGGGETAVEDVAGVNFAIYPNPAAGKFYVSVEGAEDVSVEVYNAYGVCVAAKRVSTQAEFNLQVSGVYFVRVGNTVKRVIVR